MPELMALKDAADSYSHFCPQNILQTNQTHFYLWFCLFLYKGLKWQIISLWSVFKLMVSAITDLWRTAVRIQCWYTNRRNVHVCFSQRTTLFKLKNHYDIVSKSLVPRHVLLELLVFCDKENNNKIHQDYTNLDYTKTIFLLQLRSYLHTRMWTTLQMPAYFSWVTLQNITLK